MLVKSVKRLVLCCCDVFIAVAVTETLAEETLLIYQKAVRHFHSLNNVTCAVCNI